MKKLCGSLCIALLSVFVCISCATTTSKGALPTSVGDDPFKNKVFASDTEVLQFQDDGTVIVYALDVENGGLSKEINLLYSYNTKDKIFSSQTVGIYLPNGDMLTSKEALVGAERTSRLGSAEELFSHVETPVDSSTKEIYTSLLEDSLERSAEQFFTSVITNKYAIQTNSDGEEVLVLTDIPSVDITSENITFGFDKSSSYSVALNDSLLVLADVRAGSDTCDVAYVGIPQFDTKKHLITAHLYEQTVSYAQDANGIESFSLRSVGDIRISYSITLSDVVSANDNPMGLDYYTATYQLTFTTVPQELSSLKELNYEQRRPLYDVSFVRGIIADFAQ